jgi:hypothetical protein
MADEATQPTEQEHPAPDATDESAESRVSDGQPQEPKGPGWFNRLLGRAAPAEEPEASEGEAGEPQTADDNAAPGPKQTQPRAEQPAQQQPAPSDPGAFARAVQAEVDRREARRKQEAERARLKQLRDDDPYAYAEETKRLEQENSQLETDNQRVSQVIRGTADAFDRAILDPLVLELPEQHALRRGLAESGGPVGVEGRAKLAKDAIAAIRADERARVEQRFRKDPKFRAGLFREFRGEREEPEVAPAAGPTRNGSETDMNAVIRKALLR